MNTRLSILLCFISFLIIVGCATGPSYKTAFPSGFTPINEGYGRIIFYREGRWTGSLIQPKIFLNGEIVGTAVPGGFFFIERLSGNYNIEVSGIKLNLTLDPNETRYIEMIDIPRPGIVSIRPILVSAEQGQYMVRKLKYISQNNKRSDLEDNGISP